MALYVGSLLVLPYVPPRLAWKVALGVAAGAPLVLLYTYPALAGDVFDYLMSGRILSAYGANPYVDIPSAFPSDPYYAPVVWKDLPSAYGPAWIIMSAAITEVCGTRALAALMLGKFVAILSHWGTAALVYAITRKLAPERALLAFVAYAWSPLVLVYFAVDGHNDALMLLLLMASIYLALDSRWELSLPLLTLSALIKFVPALLLPLLLWKARHDRRAVAFGLVASLTLAMLVYAPLWAGMDTFDGVRNQAAKMTSSPAALAGFYVTDSWLRPASLLLFAAGYLVVLKRGAGVAQGAYAVLLLYLLVLSFWTKPWYFTWTVALGAVLGGYAFWITVPGVLGLFASNIFGSWGWQMNWLDWQQRWGAKFIEACLTAATLGGWLLGGVGVLMIDKLRRDTAARRAVARSAERSVG
jgi:hypothetical protein